MVRLTIPWRVWPVASGQWCGLLRFYSPFWDDLLEALLPSPHRHYCSLGLGNVQ